MQAIQQSMYVNPSQAPQSNINIGIPALSSLYFNLGNSGFRISDGIQKSSDDSLHLDINNLLGKLKPNNYINQSLQVDLFSAGFRLGKNYFTLSVIEKENINFVYPKSFMEWAWQGNGAYLGQNMSFNFGLNAVHYREYGIGMAREVTDKLSVGIKVKYLYGMENVWAQSSNVTFNTASSDYGYSASDDIRINTAGVDSGSFNNFNAPQYLFKKDNGGMAVDLGATYKFNDKITFSASLIDLGYINWNTQLANYSGSGSFQFDGIDLNQFTKSGDSALTKLADSAKKTFNISTTHQSYKTMLPAKVYIGADYKLSDKANAGVLLYGQFFDNIVSPAIALSYNLKLNSWFSASASYAIMNNDFSNIGLGFAITGPVQWYVVTDNAIGLILPESTKTFTIRTGINLCFGRKPKKKDSASFDGSDKNTTTSPPASPPASTTPAPEPPKQ
jgi:hypothetical protein